MANPAASPAVSSTVGLKNMVIAPLTVDTEETLTYGALQLVAGAIEASITPQNSDPDVQYFDDQEGDVLYPDPELSFKTKLADLPLIIQEMIFANKIDDNGVMIRSSTDKPPYFAVGFKSEKANHKYRFVWLYKVRAKPVTESYATKEGKASPARPARWNGRLFAAPMIISIRRWPMKEKMASRLKRARRSWKACTSRYSRPARDRFTPLFSAQCVLRGESFR